MFRKRETPQNHQAGVSLFKKARDSHSGEELVRPPHGEASKKKPPQALGSHLREVPEAHPHVLPDRTSRDRLLRGVLPPGDLLRSTVSLPQTPPPAAPDR